MKPQGRRFDMIPGDSHAHPGPRLFGLRPLKPEFRAAPREMLGRLAAALGNSVIEDPLEQNQPQAAGGT